MDIYQKRKERQEKKNSNESDKNSINCLSLFYLIPSTSSYKIGKK